MARNRLVASLVDELLIACAEPWSRTATLAAEALAWGKPIYALSYPANTTLLRAAVRGMEGDGLPLFM